MTSLDITISLEILPTDYTLPSFPFLPQWRAGQEEELIIIEKEREVTKIHMVWFL